MTILSAQRILELVKYSTDPIMTNCIMETRKDSQGNSVGLTACGYDMRLWKDVSFYKDKFILVAAMEEFNIPSGVVGRIYNKSSLARRGLHVWTTVAEPGWRGFLTLEVENRGDYPIHLREGDAIAQIMFEYLDAPTALPYKGKYQDQKAGPQSHK